MAWTYDPSQLGSDPMTQVRFLIQDTQETRPLLQDEEITWALSTEANIYSAAALCCESLVAKAGPVKSRTVGDLSITYDPAFYRGLAGQLRSRGLTHQMPSAGGLSLSEKIAQASDTDAVAPAFARGLTENPTAPQPTVAPIDQTLLP